MTSGTTLRWLPVSHSKHLVQLILLQEVMSNQKD